MVSESTNRPGQKELEPKQEASAESSATESNVTRRSSPPPPPPTAGQNVQVALGMQLMQQSSFDQLDESIQNRLIDLLDEQDRRQFEYYSSWLQHQSDFNKVSLEDSATARKQGLWAMSSVGGLALLIGGAGTLFLLYQGEYQWGFTLLMAGLGIAGAFLGGTGLPGFIRAISSGLRDRE